MEIVKGIACTLNIIFVLMTFIACVKEDTETKITGAFVASLLVLDSALIAFGA